MPKVAMKPKEQREIWSVQDAAEFLCCSTELISKMAREKKIPAVKIGSIWRFHNQAIRQLAPVK